MPKLNPTTMMTPIPSTLVILGPNTREARYTVKDNHTVWDSVNECSVCVGATLTNSERIAELINQYGL